MINEKIFKIVKQSMLSDRNIHNRNNKGAKDNIKIYSDYCFRTRRYNYDKKGN